MSSMTFRRIITERYPIHHGGMTVFEGSRRQRGGNIFGMLKRMLVPTLKTVGKKMIPTLKTVGKEAATRGLKMGVGVIKDKLSNKGTTLKEALKGRSAQALNEIAHDYLGDDVPMTSQDGEGLRRRRRRKRKRKTAPSRKAKRRRRSAAALLTTALKRRSRKKLKRLKRKAKSINKVKRRRGRHAITDILS